MHILVADRTVVLRTRDPFLAASAVRGGGRGGLARRFRVGFADPGVRECVGRDGGLGEDLGELGGEEGSVVRVCISLWVVSVNELVFEVDDLLLVPMSGRLAYLKNCTKHGRSDGVYTQMSRRETIVRTFEEYEELSDCG